MVNLPVTKSTTFVSDGLNDFPNIGIELYCASNSVLLILLPPIALYSLISISSLLLPYVKGNGSFILSFLV